jgi:protein TonB
MVKGDMIERIVRPPIKVDFIDETKVPPEKVQPQPPHPQQPPQDSHVTVTRPLVDQHTARTFEFPPLPPPPPTDFGRGTLVDPPLPPPPPPPPRTVEPARAHADLASYVSSADYPDAALRAEQQGMTRFRLLVGPDGRVTDCIVTGSSGSSSLDATTCRLMKSRARFTPARDSSGKPTTDTVANAIRWVLPDG